MNETAKSRFLVGIDLGTSNSALYFIDQEDLTSQLHHFQIPQWIDVGQMHKTPTLASNLYLLTPDEIQSQNFKLPWESETAPFVVGQWARQQRGRQAGRCINSVKSWLCYYGVDPHSKFLPQTDLPDASQHSPIGVTTTFLNHFKAAWNFQFAKEHPEYCLEQQEVVVTVPASFDEAAREYTVDAIQKAGFQHFTLLEEPQAAFYSWIASTPLEEMKNITEEQIILVVDIGGGTTDFSLIRMQPEPGKETPSFERIAVSDHILLGGDNIDLTLANHLEKELTSGKKKLSPRLWEALVSQCHQAKETLLTEQTNHYPITIAEGGSRLLGKTRSTELKMDQAKEIILDGFFPLVPWDSPSVKMRSHGLRHVGLPYAQEPAITRHLCDFLKQSLADNNLASSFPNRILFNGGMLSPTILRERLQQQLEQWQQEISSPKKSTNEKSIILLETPSLHLAVARGATYFQLARQGKGIRITGGSARSYYVSVLVQNEATDSMEERWLCILPQNATVESSISVADFQFLLSINKTVQFRLISSTHRPHDKTGTIFQISEEELESQFIQLPPIQTFIGLDKRTLLRKTKAVEVNLHAQLNEIGTLSLLCVASQYQKEWKLEFRIQSASDQPLTSDEGPIEEEGILPANWESAVQLIRQWFGKRSRNQSKQEIRTFNAYRLLEEELGVPRKEWPIQLLRKFWDLLYEGETLRVRSSHHELNWIRLSGLCLRPGFGYTGDEGRINQITQLLKDGIHFKNDRQMDVEWWIMWRRIAGGLSSKTQMTLLELVQPYLNPAPVKKKAQSLPRKRSGKKKSAQMDPASLSEHWRLVASLEDVPASEKVKLGQKLIDQIKAGKTTSVDGWCLARLGARVPLYGKPVNVISPSIVESWIDWGLSLNNHPLQKDLPFVLTKLAQATDDRHRDVTAATRKRVLDFLRRQSDTEALQLMCDGKEENPTEQASPQFNDWLYGDSLPTGLRFIGP